ncbi:MAG: hypothetical protein WD009_02225, partial [Phycisphaeraceae bacterium]
MAQRFAIVLALLLALPAAAAGDDAAEIARRVHRDGGYPRQLYVQDDAGGVPQLVLGPGSDDADDLPGDARDATSAGGDDGRGFGLWPRSTGLSRVLAQVLLILTVAMLIGFALWLLLAKRSRASSPGAAAAAQRDGAGDDPAGPVVDDAADPDALAQRGRVNEAMRLLLLRALEAAGWCAEGDGRSRTAREVVAGLGAHHPGRTPLQQIVRAVEIVRFGG